MDEGAGVPAGAGIVALMVARMKVTRSNYGSGIRRSAGGEFTPLC